MNRTQAFMDRVSGAVVRHRGLILPVCAGLCLLVLLAPLPPLVLDILLAANIALAAVVLLTAISVASPLEFSVFPSVLLGATLMRLVLNIATTRLILTAGQDRTLEQAQYAAGNMVWSFGNMMTHQSLAVGLILFVVITLIQFVIVTRGAARISEVAARFVLDAMPGKQMSIDAELNAGLINEEQARNRRSRLEDETDFYGAMDGSSKFLRGDALAAAAITAINIAGGLYLGAVQYHWSWGQTLGLFTRLTIGEGLVMQVPSLIIAIASAIIVTRGSRKRNLGEDVLTQLGGSPVALAIAGVFLGLMAMTPLPKLPMLLIGAGCAGIAWMLSRRGKVAAAPVNQAAALEPATGSTAGQNFEELLTVDPMRIELGYGLVRLVDSAGQGDLLGRITSLRKQIASELGLLVPPIRIRDELRLDSHLYVFRLRGETVASGRLFQNMLMVVSPQGQLPAGLELHGRSADSPLTGARTVWISHDQKSQAQAAGCELLSASDVLVRHLGQVIRAHAAELLPRQQVTRMLDNLRASSPSLVAEASERLRTGQIHKVLQSLLREEVPIRDLEKIVEAMVEASLHTTDLAELTEHVRSTLGRTLSQRYCDDGGKLHCVMLEGQLEETLGAYVSQDGGSGVPTEMTGRLTHALGEALEGLKRSGKRPIVLCSPRVRPALRRMLGPSMPETAVLSYSEIDSVEVEPSATIRI